MDPLSFDGETKAIDVFCQVSWKDFFGSSLCFLSFFVLLRLSLDESTP